MALNADTEMLSLLTLEEKLNTEVKKGKLSHSPLDGEKMKTLLRKINNLAAAENILLSGQSDATINILLLGLHKATNDNEKTAKNLFLRVSKQMQAESDYERKQHQQSSLSSLPWHERGLKEEMCDHDFIALLPKIKADASVTILATRNTKDSDTQATALALQSTVQDELKNPKRKAIIFPLGPGHWRVAYLIKKEIKENEEPRYLLQVFDSMGPESGKSGMDNMVEFLHQCDPQVTKNLEKNCYGPPCATQTNSYSCGDYAMADIHRRVSKFPGNDKTTTNPELIKTLTSLETSTQVQKKLREITRDMSREKQLAQNNPAPAVLNSETVALKEEKNTLNTETVVLKEERNTFNNKHALDVIKSRLAIFSQAEKVSAKQKGTEPLSDEELATLYQAEELNKAGYKP